MTATSEGRPARAAEPRGGAGWASWSKPWRGVAALLLALVVGFGGWSTWAYWSDQAALTTGSFTSAKLDLRLDGINADGLGTGYAKSAINLSSMLPGESQAYAITITNTNATTVNPAVTYSASVAYGSGATMGPGTLQLRIATGTPSNPSVPANALRTGTCLNSTPIAGPTSISASSASVFSGRDLASGASEPLCLVVSMPTTVGVGQQNTTATLVITFVATQATA